MKNILEFLIFALAVIGIPIGAMLLVEEIVQIITMEMIMSIVYVILGLSLIYIMKY